MRSRVEAEGTGSGRGGRKETSEEAWLTTKSTVLSELLSIGPALQDRIGAKHLHTPYRNTLTAWLKVRGSIISDYISVIQGFNHITLY